VQNNGNKLTSAILNLIESQRNGETIDQDLVKKVIESFGSYQTPFVRYFS
jgi:cullin 1